MDYIHALMILLYCLDLTKSLPVNLIANNFKQIDIYSIVVITCASKEEKLLVFKELLSHGMKISFSWQRIESMPSHRMGAVLDLDCPQLESIVTEVTKEKIFNMHTEWLLINKIFNESLENITDLDTPIETAALKVISQSYALPGSCIRLVQLWLKTGRADFYDMYRVSMLRSMKFKLDWSGYEDEFLTNNISSCAQRKRSDFEGVTLKGGSSVVYTELIRNFDKIQRDDVPEIDFWAMVHYPIARLVAEQLNFTLEMVLMDDYGYLTNGSFDGLMGLLQRDEVDFSATGLIMRRSRFIAVQFTAETFELKTAVISKQPPLSSVSNIFILPFTQLVWISCTLLSLIVTGILLLEYYLSKSLIKNPYTQEYTSLADLITMVLSTICQQGTELAPVSLPARITVFIFSLFAFFCFTSYSANIVALLQSSAPILKTLNDITNSRLGFKVQNLTYNRYYFRTAVDEDVINLYEKKVKPQGTKAYLEPADGMKLMRTGAYAFSVETNHAYRIISDTFKEHEKCGLSEIRIFFIPKLSIGVVRRSGYREHITRKIAWQREIGILSRIKSFWLPHRPQCESQAGNFVSVTIDDFMPALLVLAYGTITALVIFLMELVLYYRLKKIKKRRANVKNMIMYN